MSRYSELLLKSVIDNSVNNTWNDAVEEWDVEDCIEDEEMRSSCVCGKENLRFLFTMAVFKISVDMV